MWNSAVVCSFGLYPISFLRLNCIYYARFPCGFLAQNGRRPNRLWNACQLFSKHALYCSFCKTQQEQAYLQVVRRNVQSGDKCVIVNLHAFTRTRKGIKADLGWLIRKTLRTDLASEPVYFRRHVKRAPELGDVSDKLLANPATFDLLLLCCSQTSELLRGEICWIIWKHGMLSHMDIVFWTGNHGHKMMHPAPIF